MLQVNVFWEIRQRQRIRPKPICHRLIPVANRFCCLGVPSGRVLPSRLHFLSGCRPVLIRDLSVLMLRFRVLGRRADETGPDRRRNKPFAAGAAGAVPVRWAPARGAAESSGSVARPSLGNPDGTLNSEMTLVYPRHSRPNCDTRRREHDRGARPSAESVPRSDKRSTAAGNSERRRRRGVSRLNNATLEMDSA